MKILRIIFIMCFIIMACDISGLSVPGATILPTTTSLSEQTLSPTLTLTSEPEINGTWNVHMLWDCNNPAQNVIWVIQNNDVSFTDNNGGKIPEGSARIIKDTGFGNFDFYNKEDSLIPEEYFIINLYNKIIFIKSYHFMGQINAERNQIKNGKFDIISYHGNEGIVVSGCWEAEKR